jgi:hypothetical protein
VLKLLSYFLILSAVWGCESINIAPSAPDCLKELIRTSKSEPQEISSYVYNGKTVYLVIPDCCDQYISLYDENCTYLCAPSGGLTGKGDGKCPDFYDKAIKGAQIWKKV